MSVQNLFSSSNILDPTFDIYCDDLYANNIHVSSSGSINISGDIFANNITSFNSILSHDTITSSGTLMANSLFVQNDITAFGTILGDTVNANNINSANEITSSGALNGATIFSSGNITSSGDVYSNSSHSNIYINSFNYVPTHTFSGDMSISGSRFIGNLYNLTGSGLGTVTLTLPNAIDLSGIVKLNDTFTFYLTNQGIGSTVLTMADSTSGTMSRKFNWNMPGNTSGNVFSQRTCVGWVEHNDLTQADAIIIY